MLPSVRNIPFLMWVAVNDELVPILSTQEQAQHLDDLEYRYDLWRFSPADHLTLAINDQYAPVADFLGKTKVDRDPFHVTYVRNPTMDFDHVQTTADHAYWLSDIQVRDDSGDAPRGQIDVFSEGFGRDDPEVQPTQNDAGVLTGGNLGGLPFTRQFKEWGQPGDAPKRDQLDIDARNIRQTTVNVKRARVDCKAKLDVTTDGPLEIRLMGCNRVEHFDTGP